jgi:OmpR family response regulator RpaB
VVYNKKILVVNNEVEISKLLSVRLTNLGYKVFLAFSGKEALISFSQDQPDLIIIDIILPILDGYEVCRKIRENSQIPIIILTSLNNISDRVQSLALGADDYITKPFSPQELEARIKALFRRTNPSHETLTKRKKHIFHVGNLIIDRNRKIILKNNSAIKLTNIEFNVLELLLENTGNYLSRTKILDNIWGYTPERHVDTRIVDVHISRLRAKIEENPRTPDLIITARGKGYKFQVD